MGRSMKEVISVEEISNMLIVQANAIEGLLKRG